jgi:hypothetical protein
MAAWFIRVTAKQREHIDAYLVAQAVIAYARQLWERERKVKLEPGPSSDGREVSP